MIWLNYIYSSISTKYVYSRTLLFDKSCKENCEKSWDVFSFIEKKMNGYNHTSVKQFCFNFKFCSKLKFKINYLR